MFAIAHQNNYKITNFYKPIFIFFRFIFKKSLGHSPVSNYSRVQCDWFWQVFLCNYSNRIVGTLSRPPPPIEPPPRSRCITGVQVGDVRSFFIIFLKDSIVDKNNWTNTYFHSDFLTTLGASPQVSSLIVVK